MFEARLAQGSVLKKILEAIKDLVPHANWDCSDTGISVQAMDSSHVSLVSLSLSYDGFDPFRCDRNITLGMDTPTLSKVLKCASNDDSITIKAEDSSDTVSFVFESQSKKFIIIYVYTVNFVVQNYYHVAFNLLRVFIKQIVIILCENCIFSLEFKIVTFSKFHSTFAII